MRVEQVMFRSGAVRCAADLYLPDNIQKTAPVPGLVIGHGFAMVKEALVPHAEYLVRAGYMVLAIDYRTFGASEGEPRGQLFPFNQVEDFRNGISYLQTRREVDPHRIGIWGVSFGGGVVIQTAAMDRRVKCVVAQSPGVNLRKVMKDLRGSEGWVQLLDRLEQDWQRRFETGKGERVPALARQTRDVFPAAPGDDLASHFMAEAERLFPTFRNEILLESMEHLLVWAPEYFIEHIAPRPLLIVTNGAYDLHHPLEHIQIAFRKAGEPKRLEILPYDVVGLYVEPGLGEAMGHAIAWFDHYLRTERLLG